MSDLTDAQTQRLLASRNSVIHSVSGVGTSSVVVTLFDRSQVTFSAAASLITATAGAAQALRRGGAITGVEGLGTANVRLVEDTGRGALLEALGDVILATPLDADTQSIADAGRLGSAAGSVQAKLDAAQSGANNDLRFTSVAYGLTGNRWNVTYTTAADQTLSVTISGYDITVNLTCGPDEVPIDTGNEVIAAVQAQQILTYTAPFATDYWTVANKPGNSGAGGLSTGMTKSYFSGGA